MRDDESAMLASYPIDSFQLTIHWIVASQDRPRISWIVYIPVPETMACPFLTNQSDEMLIMVEAIGNSSEIIPLVVCEEFGVISQREDVQKSFIASERIEFLRTTQPI
jgi:hypothetical protein